MGVVWISSHPFLHCEGFTCAFEMQINANINQDILRGIFKRIQTPAKSSLVD